MIENDKSNSIKRFLKDVAKPTARFMVAMGAFLILINMLGSTHIAYAGVESSVFVTGTEKLLGDITTAGLLIAPGVAIAVIVYCFIRMTFSDEHEAKVWKKRITTALFAGIGATSAAALIKLLFSYYK